MSDATTPRRLASVLGLALGLLAPAALAVPADGAAGVIALAPGVSVAWVTRSCGSGRARWPCSAWVGQGLALDGDVRLGHAQTFAAAPGGRILAAVPGALLFTDDRGACWQTARWEGTQQPTSLAFGTTGDFGAAVGSAGAVWTTEDRGESWRQRRDGGDTVLVDVAVAGHIVVYADDGGGAWVTHEGSGMIRTLAEPEAAAFTAQVPTIAVGCRPPRALPRPRATLLPAGGAVWVRLGDGRAFRVDDIGGIEEVSGPSR